MRVQIIRIFLEKNPKYDYYLYTCYISFWFGSNSTDVEYMPHFKNNNCLVEENENDPESLAEQGEIVTGDSSSNSLNNNENHQQHQSHQPSSHHTQYQHDVLTGLNYTQIKKTHPPQIETTAPAIDFKLNVKIEIKSGKCVLHANKNGVLRQQSNTPNSTGPSGFGAKTGADNVFSNPYNPYSNIVPNFMSFPAQTNNLATEQEMKNTNFIFPAIGVKAFYESNHKKIENKLAKKANLYAMIKLESFVMPQKAYAGFINNRDVYNSRDMCISPALLDFLEQTLEPFDMIKASLESATLATTPAFSKLNRNLSDYNNPASKHSSSRSSSLSTNDEFTDATITDANGEESFYSGVRKRTHTGENFGGELQQQQQQETTTYFPVDVVVFVSMFPSSVRFTCLPHSTMECLLKLPTLEMIFSTNRLDENVKEKLSSKMNGDFAKENLENIFKGAKKNYEVRVIKNARDREFKDLWRTNFFLFIYFFQVKLFNVG